MVFAASQATRDELVARHALDPDQVALVPPGVSARFAPVSPAECAGLCKHHGLDAPFVLYRAGHDLRMDTSLLLHAFARLRKKRKDRVLLVCEGDLEADPAHAAFQSLVEELRLGKVVRFIGEVPVEHEARLVGAARVVAIPARADGAGAAALEAMACGTPVISSKAGSLPEVVGGAGLVVPEADVEAWVRALTSLQHDPTARSVLRAQGLERAKSFDWATIAATQVRLYREVLA